MGDLDCKSLIDRDFSLSVRKQCEVLEINRSSLYYKPVGETVLNLELMTLLDKHFLEHPSYGVLQMQDYLRSEGCQVNEKRVRRLLRKMGVMAIYPQKNLSKLLHREYIHPYLLRALKIERSNQVWEIDITYIAMKKGFMYLTAIIDVHSRYVVGWSLSNSLNAKVQQNLLLDCIKKHGIPEIVNSDQCSQFTCEAWVNLLKKQEIKISMDGRGRALDNIYIERLWRTVKRDYVYLNPAEDGLELYLGLKTFFDHYNNEKTHQGINRRIPAQVYKQVA